KSFETPEAARAAAIAVINNAHNGIDVRTARELTVDGLGRLYLAQYHEMEASAEKTKRNVNLAFRRLSPIIGLITLENLKSADVAPAIATFRGEGARVGSLKK